MPEEVQNKKISTELELDVSDFTKNVEKAADKAEDLDEEIKALKEELKKMGVEGEKNSKKVESGLNKIIPKFLGFAAVAKVLKSSWTNMVSMEQATANLNYTLGKSGDIVTDFARKNSRALNISEMQILSISSDFAVLLKNITDNDEAIANLSNTFIVQMNRISAVTGRSLDDISNRYASLIRGNMSAFRDLGIDTRKEYLMLTDTFKKYAGDRAWEELSRNEQTQIALIETMIQVDEKFGEDVDTTAGRLGKLQSRWENLTTTLGSFLSIATPLIDFFAGILETATDGFEGLQQLGDGMQYVVIGGVAFITFAPQIIKGLTALFTGSVKASTGFMMLGASILWFALTAAAAFKKSNDDGAESLDNEAESAGNATEEVEDLADAYKEAKKAKTGLMGIDEINTLSGGSQDTSSILEGSDFEGTKNSEWLDEYLQTQEDLQASMDETIQKTEEEMESMNTLMNVIMAVVGAYSAATLVIKLITSLKNKKRIAALQEALAEKQAEAAQRAKNVAEQEGAGTSVAAAAGSTKAATAAQGEATANLGATASIAAKNTAQTWGAWAAIGIPLIAGVIGGIVALASSVKLAHGGVATGETYATIGEGQYNEAVIPLGNSPEFKQMKMDIADEIAERGGAGTDTPVVQTIVKIDSREIVEATSDEMYEDWRKKGRIS